MILLYFLIADKRLPSKSNNILAAPLVANPVYGLQEDVYALRVSENEDNEYDSHLETGMLLVKYNTFY